MQPRNTHYLLDGDGEVEQYFSPSPEELAALAADGRTVHEVPEAMQQAHVKWNAVEGEFEEDLDEARAERRREFKAARDAAISAGVDTPSGFVQTDKDSRDMIDALAGAASRQLGWTADFILANNTTASVGAADMQAIQDAKDDLVATKYSRFNLLVAQLEAATSLAEIAAVENFDE